ncbi:MAG TPA: DUF1343 domain-containing protein, partial [Bacteroidales bacterium]|nr:DUF1343 domain-containing protein [Bacteroidales bacterium]
LAGDLPHSLKGKRVSVLCHAPSIARDFTHITDILSEIKDVRLSAIFGPQHGIFGQTQDNMIEWEGAMHPKYGIPVFSLYGQHRKPTPEMLDETDALLIDLQDVGARLYTYIWTVKLCMEACAEQNIPIWVLDRPNPIGKLSADGPVLKEEYFTFVGGASIPLCHRMTIGEMALWIRDKYHPGCELNVIWMKGWHRSSLYSETGLPWVLPSPNMPSLQTALVYPGTVLAEALNLSEGRGTTIPFELIGAPFIDVYKLKDKLDKRKIEGCVFRIHNFIPTFNKYKDEYCNGIQIHVTDPLKYRPVGVALELFDAIIETSAHDAFQFIPPPYEYETRLMPFDILSGDSVMRQTLCKRLPLKDEKERWLSEIEVFLAEFSQMSVYPE